MNKNSMIMVILVAIIVGGGVFFAGTKYQERKQSNLFRGRIGNGQVQGLQGNRIGFRPVSGEIISSDEKSVTVKLQDGSSKIVLFSDSTTINKAADATKEDLKTGEKVAIFGQENSDGSVTAQNIQINPIMRDFQKLTPTPEEN